MCTRLTDDVVERCLNSVRIDHGSAGALSQQPMNRINQLASIKQRALAKTAHGGSARILKISLQVKAGTSGLQRRIDRAHVFRHGSFVRGPGR